MENLKKQIFVKKYLRSLISNFEYDVKLICEIERLSIDETALVSNKIQGIYQAFQFIYNEEEVNIDSLKSLYLHFMPFIEKFIISDDTYNSIIDLWKKDNECYLLAKYIFDGNKFGRATSAIFSILFNKKRHQYNGEYVIFPGFSFKKLKDSLSSTEEYLNVVLAIESANKKYFVEKKLFSNEEILTKVNSISKDALDFLNVEEIRIFGSYFKNTQNKYSDIDFLIVTNDKNFDNNLTKSLLGKQFTDLFGEYVDLHAIDINSTKLDQFDFVVLLNSKCIRKNGII